MAFTCTWRYWCKQRWLAHCYVEVVISLISRYKISWLHPDPRKQRKLIPLKISRYTVIIFGIFPPIMARKEVIMWLIKQSHSHACNIIECEVLDVCRGQWWWRWSWYLPWALWIGITAFRSGKENQEAKALINNVMTLYMDHSHGQCITCYVIYSCKCHPQLECNTLYHVLSIKTILVN